MTEYDAAEWKRSQRHGRERGCWVYVPQEVLREAMNDSAAINPPPRYRVEAASRTRNGVLVRFERERASA
jgi:hypothetical protein